MYGAEKIHPRMLVRKMAAECPGRDMIFPGPNLPTVTTAVKKYIYICMLGYFLYLKVLIFHLYMSTLFLNVHSYAEHTEISHSYLTETDRVHLNHDI
jgi:hypothetical protein